MRCLIFVATILLLIGCKTSYIPIESVRTEYHTRDSIRTDSIYLRDSVFVQTIADTVYLYKYREQYRYLYIDRRDTLLVCDTIQVPYPIASDLSWWERVRIRVGEGAMGLIALLLLYFVAKRII